jgi:hypothetical protein
MKTKIGITALILLTMIIPTTIADDAVKQVGIVMDTEQFEPLIWICDHRIVLDDSVEPGKTSPGGSELIERVENYAFEGEQISWQVLVMDKNGIEKIEDVYVGLGDERDSTFVKEVNCQIDSVLRERGEIDDSCNARVGEEDLDEAPADNILAYYTCTLTVETPISMYGQYWIRAEVKDLDGFIGHVDELEYWFLNPNIAIGIDGLIDFGTVTPGTNSYSETILVGNEADPGSGVLLDMFIAGTDFYDPSSSGAKCPSTNQLNLDNFAYFASNGAYSTQGLGCSDSEGYKSIPHGSKISQAKEIIGCDLYGVDGYKAGNILSPGAEMALTFRLDLPEPCNGDFSDGSIFFWGEAV